MQLDRDIFSPSREMRRPDIEWNDNQGRLVFDKITDTLNIWQRGLNECKDKVDSINSKLDYAQRGLNV